MRLSFSGRDTRHAINAINAINEQYGWRSYIEIYKNYVKEL